MTSTRTEQVNGFFPKNEREYLAERRVGNVTRIRLDHNRNLDVVYEGEINGEEAFATQTPRQLGDAIGSWRSRLIYLSFYSTLPEGHGIRSIDFDSFHRCYYRYDNDSTEYELNRERLQKAGLWEDRK